MYAVSQQYGPAVRAGGAQIFTVDALVSGAVIAGGADLPVLSGTVTDTSAGGVRRQVDLELLAVPGLFDVLSPVGTQIRVRVSVRYPDGTLETVPMGVFVIDSVTMGYGPKAALKIQGSDRWALIQRARFLTPRVSNPGLPIRNQIAELITDVFPGMAVTVNASATTVTGVLVWDQDRDKAILDLAESIGAVVYFNRDGLAVIDDLPSMAAKVPVWSVDASASGVMLDADRSRDRSKTYNVVVVNSENTDGTTLFDPVVLQDTDPASPTYVSGPFGQVPYFFTSPLLTNADQARIAGGAILARVTGLNAQLTLSAVPNRALDVYDTIEVLLPQERYDVARPVERHLIDKVTHPLTPDGPQSIDTRSTRSDAA